MNIRIYQIEGTSKDDYPVGMAMRQLMRVHSCCRAEGWHYSLVYEGVINFPDPDTAICAFNMNPPPDYVGRPLSASDVVELIDYNKRSTFLFIEFFGYKKIRFDTSHKKLDVNLAKEDRQTKPVSLSDCTAYPSFNADRHYGELHCRRCCRKMEI